MTLEELLNKRVAIPTEDGGVLASVKPEFRIAVTSEGSDTKIAVYARGLKDGPLHFIVQGDELIPDE